MSRFQMRTHFTVADNSGAITLSCIKVLSGSPRVGATIVASVTKAMPRSRIKKGDVVKAIVVSTGAPTRRQDGSVVRAFVKGISGRKSKGRNAAILVNQNNEPIGTRVFGANFREVRDVHPKIASLSEELV
jgi:large subunit ribosomal protein L14